VMITITKFSLNQSIGFGDETHGGTEWTCHVQQADTPYINCRARNTGTWSITDVMLH
jgi:hypothetical protein